MPLSERTLREAAGDRSYARGEDYVRYVRGLRVTAEKAHASVQAKQVYTVELDWSDPKPDGYRTCPHRSDGNFCKHLVAVGLAVIDSGTVDDITQAASELEATVQAVRATAASGDDTIAKAEFEAYVRNALEFRGFVDYRESYAVAQAASHVLDELENHLNSGSAEIVRPALLRALTLLRTITEQAADRYGPGWAWQELATQGAEARPVAAADLYRPQLENDLQRPNTRLYPGIAATLATMAELYEKGGRGADFAVYIAKIRQDYGRRPSLMKAIRAKDSERSPAV